MGKYGCFPDCSEMMSKPVFAEATINLRRGRLMSSVVAHSLGSAIVFEFIALFSLGMVLMLFTCKCALVLIRERKGMQNDQVQNVELSGFQHASNKTLRTDSSENTSHFIGCCSSSLLFGHHPTNFRRGFELGESSQSTQGTLKPIKAEPTEFRYYYGLPVSELDFMDYFLYL